MKINKILMGLGAVAALSLGACSNDEPANAPDNNLSDGEPRYMAVTITTASDLSRAEGDELVSSNKDYDHGLVEESKVNTVNLYFFDAEGNAAMVKGDGSNVYTITSKELEDFDKEDDNVSNVTEAVIVIHTPKDKAIPAQIVAIVNQDNLDNDTYAGKSIAELQEMLTDGQNGDGFVMTNSVYVAGNALHIGAEVAGHLFSDRKEALENPVTIYVERTLAKVRLTSKIKKTDLSDGTVVYNPNKEDKEEKFGEKQIYVKFLGWNTTAKSTKNRLVKVIDPLWNAGWNTALPGGGWYDAYRFRSFWALNAEGNSYDYFSFEGANNTADGKKNFDGKDYTYLKENAAVDEDHLKPETPSQVIIAAQLVGEDGKAIEMAEYGGIRMSVDNLKIAFANALSLYYKQENKDDDDNVYHVYTKIDPNEIKLITATQGEEALTDADKEAGVTYGSKRYLVYATLTDDAAKKVWYAQTLNNDDLNPALTSTEVKKALIALGGAKVWKDGKTYYYFDIQHLGYGIKSAQFGQVGVVRNHVYDAALSSLVGLGTPVYRPGEVIIPEHPSDDETFIAAEIKVLSWRVVNNNIDLEW